MTRRRSLPAAVRILAAGLITGMIAVPTVGSSPSTAAPAQGGSPTDGMEERSGVRLRVLDKITARTSTFEIKVGSSAGFGGLTIVARACLVPPPTSPPDALAFLEIEERTAEGRRQPAFRGWMFASSPALSAMENAVYDVWVLDCLAE